MDFLLNTNLAMNIKTTSAFLLVFTFSLIFTGCSPGINKGISTTGIVYPAAPNPARIQYLTSISNSSQIDKKQSSLEKFVLGKKKIQTIYKPYGVFMRNGKLYVCDISVGGLEIIDFEKHTFNYFVPQSINKLKLPLNAFVDADNQLYVVDTDSKKIMIFDELGNYVTSFGLEENLKPTGIFIYENTIYIVDSENHRINVYDKTTNKFEYYFPHTEPHEDGYLYKPTNITVEANKIYVSDMGSGNVKIYSLNGTYLKKVGKYGKNIGDFVRPKGIAVDREENLFVVDASFENIQIFNKEGQLLMFFGGHYEGPGGMWLPTSVIIDYDNLQYFEKYVDPKYKLEYIIIVANQFGPDKISVYGRIVPKE